MRRFILASLVVLAVTASSGAQTPEGGAAPSGGAAKRGGASQCVDVEIAGRHTYDCLNERLKSTVGQVNPSLDAAPIDVHSSDIRLGLANTTAVRQQYGRNYGVSVVPYRPVAPVYGHSLGR